MQVCHLLAYNLEMNLYVYFLPCCERGSGGTRLASFSAYENRLRPFAEDGITTKTSNLDRVCERQSKTTFKEIIRPPVTKHFRNVTQTYRFAALTLGPAASDRRGGLDLAH